MLHMSVYDFDKIQPQYLTESYCRRIAKAENLTVARIEAGKGSTTRRHSHENEEVIILLQGTWRFRFPSGDVTLRPNQILTIAPGVEHASEVLENVIAIDVCSPGRTDWLNGEDAELHSDPDQWLWGV